MNCGKLSQWLRVGAVLTLVMLVGSMIFLSRSAAETGSELAPTTQSDADLAEQSDAERQAVEELFRVHSEIELAGNKATLLEEQIKELEGRIFSIEEAIADLDRELAAFLLDLRDILVAQQKLGAGSTFQALLQARSLSEYLQRLSYLSELSRAYRHTLEHIEEREEAQRALKAELEETKAQIERERAEVLALLAKLEAAKAELERMLAEFAERREAAEMYLAEIQAKWDALKPLFNETVKAFIDIIESGGLPPEIVDLRFSLFGGATAIIEEEKFNRIIEARDDLPELRFRFADGEMELEFPQYEVKLSGIFVVEDKKKLVFRVKSGQFYEMPMSEEAMEDLFLLQPFAFDLSSLIGKNELRELTHREGRIEIKVTIRF